MAKVFNVTGICTKHQNYMVDIHHRIDAIISDYILKDKYFTIHKARQYGKSTLLYHLEEQLKKDYIVLSISFEAADEYFQSPLSLARGFVMDISDCLHMQGIPDEILNEWESPLQEQFPIRSLGKKITALCTSCEKEIILMIDEVDKNSDNQIFMSFLGLLRTKYLARTAKKDHTFKSVILSGVYDIKNLKLKLHPGEDVKYNSPWNIAADFIIDMSFSKQDIALMLADYEQDYQTGMDVAAVSTLIYEYTSGYPYLVSRLCQLTDERIAGTKNFPDKQSAWTRQGILAAEVLLRKESNALFDDMVKKLTDFPQLKKMIQDILFCGSKFPFEKENSLVSQGVDFGFLKEKDGNIAIENRIFETKMYDLFLSELAVHNDLYQQSSIESSQYIIHGKLQMDIIMKKFYEHYMEIYGDNSQKFVEEQGRKLFLLYLKPIINGTGNYYIEAQTRDRKRTDIIVDYLGEQYIIELKIWHGEEYNCRGEKQLFQYLDNYNKDKGYLLSFNFNQKKCTGIKEIFLEGKRILEVIV